MGQESTSLPRLTSFSTRNAPRGDEVDYWRQVRREACVSVRTDPVGAGFGGEIRLGQYADFRLSTKRARAEEVRRSRSDIAQAHDEQDYLYFLFQTRGTLLRLFEETGESVMGRLRTLRLERARLVLRTQPDKPISARVRSLRVIACGSSVISTQ